MFDDPDVAARTHRIGLRRLFRIALREQVKYQEKNIPELTKMSLLYMSLGTQEELRDQIIDAAVDAVCVVEPLPTNEASFAERVEQARSRLGLLTQEIARQCAVILAEWTTLRRKLVTVKSHKHAVEDMQAHQSRLIHKHFLRDNDLSRLTHFPRYLKAAQSRIDKLRADPARDAKWMAEISPFAKPLSQSGC